MEEKQLDFKARQEADGIIISTQRRTISFIIKYLMQRF
jgi:hypothetical protein